jgi:hypothetical protein
MVQGLLLPARCFNEVQNRKSGWACVRKMPGLAACFSQQGTAICILRTFGVVFLQPAFTRYYL